MVNIMEVCVEGFESIKAGLSSGVYVLINFGRVVWVGKAKNVLAKLQAHTMQPSGWARNPFTHVEFDDALIRRCRVDQLEEVYQEVCSTIAWAPPTPRQVVLPFRRRA